MSKKKLHQNIVIVCEGSETENSYFNEIKKKAPKDLWGSITIVPEPIEEIIVRANNKRPKRNFKGGNKDECRYITKVDTSANYELYKSQPTKYVREAQLYLEDGAYSDAWAVFDKDQHSEHANAFKLAKEAGVKIAFSSLAFETWILCHFEKPTHSFEKVQCKTNRKAIGCGKAGVQCIDNKQCLCGYIRGRFYSEYAKNNNTVFANLEDKLAISYENASWIRFKNNTEPIYENQIYTNVDELIRTLLGNDDVIEWINYDAPFLFERSRLALTKKSKNITISNLSKASIIFDGNIYFCNDNGDDVDHVSRIMIEPEKPIDIIATDRRYLNLISGNKRYIFEIP